MSWYEDIPGGVVESDNIKLLWDFKSSPTGSLNIVDPTCTYILSQACPILTTCSSRESGDSTRTSRTSRKTMVTSGSICSSRAMVFFREIK